MSLLDEAKECASKRGPACTMGLFLADLPDDLAADVLAAILDPRVETTAVRLTLVARGYEPPTDGTMRRHARKLCRCG